MKIKIEDASQSEWERYVALDAEFEANLSRAFARMKRDRRRRAIRNGIAYAFLAAGAFAVHMVIWLLVNGGQS